MQQFNIDPDFSVYKLTKRSMQDTAIMNHRRTMSIISYEIENATLIDSAKTTVFSSFQRMSRFLPQLQRYRQLAAKSKHVYVFGVVDCELPAIDNLTYVPLKATDQLAKEWFLVSFGEDYYSALATEELSNIDDPDELRQFKGVWTFDVFLVSILHEWLSGIVGLRLDVHEQDAHDYQSQTNLISNTIGRLSVRLMNKQCANSLICDELDIIMKRHLHPAYHHIKDTQTTDVLRDDI
ncbi:MAG: DICT sensory domain-containing protein [Anaerolineae bacterium]